jgi:hypothetical protein
MADESEQQSTSKTIKIVQKINESTIYEPFVLQHSFVREFPGLEKTTIRDNLLCVEFSIGMAPSI